jgi:hypothetical protein
VAVVRSVGTAIEYLVLGDSPVILATGDGITPVVADRVDHLQPGGRPYTRELVRSKRNASGGFWVASTKPQAAHEAITSIVDDVTHVALLTDGVTRLVEYYLYSWMEILELLDRDGPSGLIQRVREAEHASPPPTNGYGKSPFNAAAGRPVGSGDADIRTT